MIYWIIVFLWIDLGIDLRVGEICAELIFHEQPSGAIARHRGEELDLYPDSSFAVNSGSAREIIYGFLVQGGGKNLAVRSTPDVHSAFKGNLQCGE